MKDTILASIREKRVTMRSSSSFRMEMFLLVFAVVVALFVSIALVSYIFFALRVNGHEALLGFGTQGLYPFFILFPWPLLVLDILLLIFIQKLLKRFSFAYRSPILYGLLALLVVVGAGAFALDRGTSLNDSLMREGKLGGLPGPLSNWYGHVKDKAPHEKGIYRGVVSRVGTSTIVIEHDDLDTDQDETGVLVVLPPGFDTSLLVPGMGVYIAGHEEHGLIQAFGLRILSQPER